MNPASAAQPTLAPAYGRRVRLLTPLAFGMLILAVLPAGVAVFNDDFGYLRSVVQTIQHGRPWTDDWLEPWAASLSVLSAWLFAVTGSFQFAVHGTLALLAGASFAAAAWLFRSRGHSPLAAAGLAAVLLTFPTALCKAVEFTSVAIYVPCLLLAIVAVERKSWAWYFLWWAVAIAARQSAVSWGVLPLFEFVRAVAGRVRPPGRQWLPPLAAFVGGALVFVALRAGMNQTHAQAVVTDRIYAQVHLWDVVRVFALGAWIFACAAGIAAVVNGRPVARTTVRLQRRRLAAVGVFGAATLWFMHARKTIELENRLFDGTFMKIHAAIVVATAIVGWWRNGFRVRLDFAAAAAAGLALVALRGTWWDYYFIDVALFGLFGAVELSRAEAAADNVGFRRTSFRTIALGAAAATQLVFVAELKCGVDAAYAWCVLSEEALRQGRLGPAELGYAPFGFIGWHLFPHYRTHEGKSSPNLAGFGRYLRPGAIDVSAGYSRALRVFPRFRREPPTRRANIVAAGRCPYLGFFHAEYRLIRTAREAPAAVDLTQTDYRSQRFPLDDREWKQLIAGTGP